MSSRQSNQRKWEADKIPAGAGAQVKYVYLEANSNLFDEGFH